MLLGHITFSISGRRDAYSRGIPAPEPGQCYVLDNCYSPAPPLPQVLAVGNHNLLDKYILYFWPSFLLRTIFLNEIHKTSLGVVLHFYGSDFTDISQLVTYELLHMAAVNVVYFLGIQTVQDTNIYVLNGLNPAHVPL